MRMPKNFLMTLYRVMPSLVFLPMQVLFRGRRGIYFRHPYSRIHGPMQAGWLAEIGAFCCFNASEHGIAIGDYSQINSSCSLVGSVQIGHRVLIAPGCVIASGGHTFGKGIQPRFSGSVYRGPLIVEDDVWIGANVTLLGPIKIGAGSVIAAGVTVDKDIPPASLVRRVSDSFRIEPMR
jgi:acetyltransferase-like isoleucine patch superfamily enzyme